MDNTHTFAVAPIGEDGEELAQRIRAKFVRDWAGGRNAETIHWPSLEREGRLMAVGFWFGSEKTAPFATVPMTTRPEVKPSDTLTIGLGDLPFFVSMRT
jgi:hypothetical protein